MFQRMLASALFAGAAAGLVAALLHFAFVQQFILLAEQYETGALTHFTSGPPSADAVAGGPALPESAGSAATGHAHAAGTVAVAQSQASTTSDLQRDALTVLFMGLVYISYGMLLTAGFALAESLGLRIRAVQGLLWGLAGFASFQMAPALGLAPELPGTIAAELGARQVWWWATVAATAMAIGLLAYGRAVWMYGVAAALLAAPHVIGAPQPDAYFGVSPPELAASFAARVLGTGLVVWVCLGWFAGYFWARSEPA
jgi:cobalt transporter subunit CbtA